METKTLIKKLIDHEVFRDGTLAGCEHYLFFVVDVKKTPTTAKQIDNSIAVITEAMDELMQEMVEEKQRFNYWELSSRLKKPLHIRTHCSAYGGKLGRKIKAGFKQARYVRKRDMVVEVDYFTEKLVTDITDDAVLDQMYVGWYGWDDAESVDPVITVHYAKTACDQALAGTTV